MTTSTSKRQQVLPVRPPHDIAGRGALVVALWSLLYVAAGLSWMVGGPGYPFGVQNDPQAAEQSFFGGLTQSEGAPWVVGLGFGGAAIALTMSRVHRRRVWSTALIAAALTQAVVCTFVIPDGRLLIAAAHVPILLIGKPFGWPPGVTIASQLPWPVIHQALVTGLGVMWAVTAVAFHRRVTDACQRCGRKVTPARFWKPARAARLGRWAVSAAITVPAIYAVTRLAWAVGIPLGVSRQFLLEQQRESPTIFIAGAFLALLALAGATLTQGLVQRWGEVYPRWIPGLGGRPVRPRTAIIPATTAAILLTEAGIGWVRAAAGGLFPDGAMGPDWATIAPGFLLPLWGLALGAATYTYYLRRRERCPRCGRV